MRSRRRSGPCEAEPSARAPSWTEPWPYAGRALELRRDDRRAGDRPDRPLRAHRRAAFLRLARATRGRGALRLSDVRPGEELRNHPAEDARLAVESGAWAIGMIFYPDSPRYVEVERAAEIATDSRRRCEVVGVFVNTPLDDVLRTLGSVPLTMLQLHGDEGPSYCAEAARRSGLKVIKAVRAKDVHAVRSLSRTGPTST